MYNGKNSSFLLFSISTYIIDNFDILFSYSNKQDRAVGLRGENKVPSSRGQSGPLPLRSRGPHQNLRALN